MILILATIVTLAQGAVPSVGGGISDAPPSEGPLRVAVSMHIVQANWAEHKLKIWAFIRSSWVDSRLSSDADRVVAGKANFWTPGLFSPSALKLESTGDEGARIGADGSVTHSRYVRGKLHCSLCPFSLVKDDGYTKCNLTLEPYMFTADKIELTWKDNGFSLSNDAAVTITNTTLLQSVTQLGQHRYGKLTLAFRVNTFVTKQVLWHVFDQALKN